MALARRLAVAAAIVASLVVVGVLARAWWDSRLPGTYNAMQFGKVDAGGAASSSGRVVSVAALTGPASGVPDERFTLTAEHARVRLASGKTVDALTFNGRVPGPELRVHTGDLVEVVLRNKDVREGVTIHWHGVDVPDADDGVAGVTQNAVPIGGRYVYRFRVEQTGTFWYHTHQDSEADVRRGLYGAFVIEPRQKHRASLARPGADRAHTRRSPCAEHDRRHRPANGAARNARAAAARQLERHDGELRAERDAVRRARDRRDRSEPPDPDRAQAGRRAGRRPLRRRVHDAGPRGAPRPVRIRRGARPQPRRPHGSGPERRRMAPLRPARLRLACPGRRSVPGRTSTARSC